MISIQVHGTKPMEYELMRGHVYGKNASGQTKIYDIDYHRNAIYYTN